MKDFAGVDRYGSYDVKGQQLIDAVIGQNSRYDMKRDLSGVSVAEADPSGNGITVVDGHRIIGTGVITAYGVGGEILARGSGELLLESPGTYIVHCAGIVRKVIVQ